MLRTLAKIAAPLALALLASGCSQPPRERFVYDEVYPKCADWRHRTVRSSSDAGECIDERGWVRPRRLAPKPPHLYGH